MSLIKCPECGTEVLDTAKTCANCSYQLITKDNSFNSFLDNNIKNDELLQEEPTKEQNKFLEFIGKVKGIALAHKLASIIVASFLSIVILFCSIGLPIILSNQLTTEEKMTIKNVQTLKGMLKDINSIVLNEDIEYLTIGGEDSYTYYFIDFGAKNGYGGYNRETAIFKNDEYLGKKSDASTAGTNINVAIATALALAFLNRYEVRGLDEVCKSHGFIDKDMVMEKIK